MTHKHKAPSTSSFLKIWPKSFAMRAPTAEGRSARTHSSKARHPNDPTEYESMLEPVRGNLQKISLSLSVDCLKNNNENWNQIFCLYFLLHRCCFGRIHSHGKSHIGVGQCGSTRNSRREACRAYSVSGVGHCTDLRIRGVGSVRRQSRRHATERCSSPPAKRTDSRE
jgi:hypothetical protein